MTWLAPFFALLQAHPEVATVLVYLAALAAHVGVGMLLHAVRLHDFAWDRVGQWIEADVWTARGGAILTTFLLTLITTTVPGSDWRAAFAPAFATLVAATGASTLPIVRDTLYELVQLFSGRMPLAKMPAQAERGSSAATRAALRL